MYDDGARWACYFENRWDQEFSRVIARIAELWPADFRDQPRSLYTQPIFDTTDRGIYVQPGKWTASKPSHRIYPVYIAFRYEQDLTACLLAGGKNAD